MSEIRYERDDGWQALTRDRLRIEFRWQRDRWSHVVSVRTAAGWQPVLRSAEFSRQLGGSGAYDDDEPIQTPALQQLHVDTIDGKLCAMGVGQAGAHHFATTFSFEADPVCLSVDVADRVREPHSDNGHVISAYEFADGAPAEQFHVESASESEAVVRWHSRGVERLSLRLKASREPSLRATVRIERGERGAPRLTIEPGVSATGRATRRWAYCVDRNDG